MDSKINLSQLTNLFAQASGMSRTASEQFVKTFFEIIADKVLSEGLVKVKGFGTFKLLQMEDRESVNVNTGERYTIEGHQKISFTPDAELKDSINKPFSSFETVEITEEQEKVLAEMEPAPVQEEEAKKEPQVKDVTPKRGKRIFRNIVLWILSIALVIYLAWLLLWPVFQTQILDFLERSVTENVNVRAVDKDSVSAARLQAKQELKLQAAQQEAEQPATQSEVQAETANKAVFQSSKQIEERQVAGYVEQNKGITQIFLMDEEDMLRDLSTYTAADTVKYRIAGYLTTHIMQHGETLTKLSLQYYGTKKLWPYIAAFNGITDFEHIEPATMIGIPKIAYRKK